MAAIDLGVLRSKPAIREPFPHVIVPGFVEHESLAEIHAHFPEIESPGSFPLDELTYGPAFGALVDELRGPELRRWCEEQFGVDLTGRPTTVTVRGRCGTRDGSIHTDSTSKIITVLLYLNAKWEEAGGRLRLLRSPDNLEDVIAEIPPVEGTLVAFRRTDNSYHGHKPFVGPRRVIQLNWVTDNRVRRRAIWRHRISAWGKSLLGLIRGRRADKRSDPSHAA